MTQEPKMLYGKRLYLPDVTSLKQIFSKLAYHPNFEGVSYPGQVFYPETPYYIGSPLSTHRGGKLEWRGDNTYPTLCEGVKFYGLWGQVIPGVLDEVERHMIGPAGGFEIRKVPNGVLLGVNCSSIGYRHLTLFPESFDLVAELDPETQAFIRDDDKMRANAYAEHERKQQHG